SSNPYGVPDKNGPAEIPLAHGHKCERAHRWNRCAQAAADGEHQQTVRDRATKRSAFAELVVHVYWIKVPTQACKIHDVRFRDRPAVRFPFLSRFQIIEIQMAWRKCHGEAPQIKQSIDNCYGSSKAEKPSGSGSRCTRGTGKQRLGTPLR